MKSLPPVFGYVVLTLLFVASFLIDAQNVRQGGSIDLRNRITGARLLMHGANPYTYKWSRREPEDYCDPFNNPRLPVSKTTATPALLAATMPWALFPYRNGRYLWFATQWALLLGTLALAWRRCADDHRRLLLGALFTGFTYTAAWRLNAERGQGYVPLLFLFTVWLLPTPGGRRRAFFRGFAVGMLAAFRPPFALLLPVTAWRWRGDLAGAAAGLLLGLLPPLIFSGSIWHDYFAAMDIQSYLYRNAIDPPPGPQAYPPTVEGIPTDLLANYAEIPYADFSVHGLLRKLGAEPFPAWPVLLAGAIGFGAWCRAGRTRTEERWRLGLAAWLFLLDLTLPAYRNSYNDVLALGFLAVGVIVAPRFYPALVPAALALIAGLAVYLFAPGQALLIGIPSLLLTLSAVVWLFLPRERAPRRVTLDRRAPRGQNRAC